MNPTAELSCRERGRNAAESETPVFGGAVAFTCSNCLMTTTDLLLSVAVALARTGTLSSDYNVTEARAAFSARLAMRELTI